MAQRGDVIVVGAGPGGLAAAMLLSHKGFRVKVLEKEDTVGGRSAAIRLGPYTFDTGPTFLMMFFILEEVFQKTGRDVADYLDIIQLDPIYKLQFSDREVFCSSRKETMEKEVETRFPGNGQNYRRFLREEKKRFEHLIPCLSRPYNRVSDLLKQDIIKALPYLGIRKSLFEVLGNYFTEDELKLSFTFQSKYLGMSPWECPGGFTIIPYIEQTFGIQHITGGLNKICDAMVRVIEEEGGEVITGTPVSSLVMEGRRVKGVKLADGQNLFSDYVVMNADFAYAMTELTEEGVLRKYAPQKLEGMDFSCSTFMLYLGLDKIYDLNHHNIFFAGEYRKNVEEIFKAKGLSEDLSLYIQNPSITDPTLAPPGHSALYVLVPVPNNRSGIDWERERESFRKRVLEVIAARTSIDDLEEHIQAEKIITPLDWEKDYHVYAGATFNLAHTLQQMLYFRPHNRFEELEGLYLVGGGTHPGSGLPTIYQSALISADLIGKDRDVRVYQQRGSQKGAAVSS